MKPMSWQPQTEIKQNYKNKITYISAKDLDKFKVAAKEGLRLKELLSEINTVNIQLIKVGYND